MRRCPACGNAFDVPGLRCPSCAQEPATVAGFPAFAPALARESPGFRPEYFGELAALEAGNFWFQGRNELIAWACRRFFPSASRLLEIGCGTGFVLARLADEFPLAQLTGSEIFSEGLAHARERVPHAELLQMDAREIPYADHFDLVGAFDVLEHIDDDARVLAEIHRALRRGGGLLLTVPQHPWLWSRQDEMACHVRRYVASDLKRRLMAVGFRPILRTSFVSLLLPVMWLSRRLRDLRGDDDAASELDVGRATNAVLGLVMSVERRSIQWGLRFPVGGSLLMVAQKD